MALSRWLLMAVASFWLAGCTVIVVEGNHNRIRDAGGHGGLALQQPDSGAPDWLTYAEHLERLQRLQPMQPMQPLEQRERAESPQQRRDGLPGAGQP